jgi:hypothetical protein
LPARADFGVARARKYSARKNNFCTNEPSYGAVIYRNVLDSAGGGALLRGFLTPVLSAGTQTQLTRYKMVDEHPFLIDTALPFGEYFSLPFLPQCPSMIYVTQSLRLSLLLNAYINRLPPIHRIDNLPAFCAPTK